MTWNWLKAYELYAALTPDQQDKEVKSDKRIAPSANQQAWLCWSRVKRVTSWCFSAAPRCQVQLAGEA